jgi:hypothetical protein
MGSYKVRSGDTLFGIAQRFLGNGNLWHELTGYSGDPRRMPVGITLHYPEGPSKKQPVGAGSSGGGSTPSGPAPATGTTSLTPAQNTEMGNLSGPLQAQLENEVNTFLSYLGYPGFLNANTLAYYLFKSGLWTQPYDAYQYLMTLIPKDLAGNHPWAAYGMDEVSYHELVQRFSSQWLDITGQASMPADVLDKAIRGSWTETEMQQYVLNQTSIGKDQPWIAAGQTYTQVQQAYSAMYGKLPKDTQTLATWFNFRQGFQHVGTGAAAQQTLTQEAQRRQKDVAVR